MTVEEKLNKILYTPIEIELSPKLEEIIFKINLQSNGEFTKGVIFEEIIRDLERSGLQYHPTLLLDLLKKMKDNHILFEVGGKWYSTML